MIHCLLSRNVRSHLFWSQRRNDWTAAWERKSLGCPSASHYTWKATFTWSIPVKTSNLNRLNENVLFIFMHLAMWWLCLSICLLTECNMSETVYAKFEDFHLLRLEDEFIRFCWSWLKGEVFKVKVKNSYPNYDKMLWWFRFFVLLGLYYFCEELMSEIRAF